MVSLVVTILIAAFASLVSFFLGVFNAEKVRPLVDRTTLSDVTEHPALKALTRYVKSFIRRDAVGHTGPDTDKLVSGYSELVTSPLRLANLAAQAGPGELHRTLEEAERLVAKPDLTQFNCRVAVTTRQQNDSDSDMFNVEVCGAIDVPDECGEVTLNISIDDITEGRHDCPSVSTRCDHAHLQQHSPFCYTTSLGKLPPGRTNLSDWTVVARLRCDRLWLPRKGRRLLQFNCVIALAEENCELDYAEATCTYDSPDIGYLDFEQNCQRAINLGVGMAFAVSASDSKLFSCEIDLIKDWARNHVSLAGQSDQEHRELEKQLDKTVAFFRKGNSLNMQDVCREMVKIAPMAERYDILELCLRVAQAKGMAASEELDILRDISAWMQVDPGKFRAMMEKILPIGIHEVQDSRAVLGITDDMSDEQVKQHLTREYAKWNSRVTNPDPEVRNQANQMLTLVAEVRERLAKQEATA